MSQAKPQLAKAQRGYYQLPSTASALSARITALRRHVLPGSVLDIGCNDGTITKTLLDEDRITRAQGIDLEILHNHFPVQVEDILNLRPTALGHFENIFYLNVHHHLISSTKSTHPRSKPFRLLHGLIGSCQRLFFDMGSVTERGNWNWLKILRQQFADDATAVSSILQDRLYYEILRYPMQGGVRKLYLVMGNAPDHWAVKNVRWFARNVAAYPLSKRMASVDGPQGFPPGRVGAAPNDWMPHVKFVIFDHGGKKFFGKRHDHEKYDLPLTLKIYDELRHTRFAPHVVQPLYYTRQYGLVWDYEPELMIPPLGNALVVHLHDVRLEQFGLNTSPYCDLISELANLEITIDGVSKRVCDWCDFQTVKTSQGLKFIDFDAF